jgi:hypothetical protein
VKIAGRPSSPNIIEETQPKRDLLDWLVELPVYSANNWRNRLFPADVGLPRIDFSPASLQGGIDREYGQRVAATNRDIIREAGRSDIVPISKGDNLYLLDGKGKVVEGYDSPFFQQSLARAGGDTAPDLKTWNYVTAASKARKVEPASVGSAALRLTSSVPSDVIDTLIAEAGADPDGLAAVAHVINNRSSQWGMTPEQVVKQKGQFEGYYNPGPKSREAQKMPEVRAAAEKAWQAVQAGAIPDPTKGGTSFRTKGYKQPAPNGTVTIAGNTFALGTAKPNSAVNAINRAAPLPMPPRPPTLSAFASTPTLDPMRSLQDTLNAKAERIRAGTDTQTTQRAVATPPVPMPAPPPSRGVGTGYLAPATKVQTVRIDPLTNKVIPSAPLTRTPVTAQAPAPRPVSKPPNVTYVPSTPAPTPFQTANRTMVQGVPFVGPIVNGVVSAVDLVSNRPSAAAQAKPAPQPVTLPSVIPPTPKGYNTLTGKYETMQPSTPYAAGPAPVRVADNKSPARLYPTVTAPTMQETLDEQALMRRPRVPQLTPATLPRLPMPKPAALNRPIVPVRTAPIPAARIPLPQTRTVNPVSQIIPAVQARAGQTLFGRLFNMATAGVVPQASTASNNAPHVSAAPVYSSNLQHNPNFGPAPGVHPHLNQFGMFD